ncbi:hypothetical protein M407DRAFT_217739 [Tulasnella calospora MUT 4182]|uniref:RRM domain-containing protein n=1 Tax=Tulasnella calospora MUT 4182 TaxID=1051891 RepID=A0A0C3QTU4_9AGAM|nr:hypothetical protein M407DRAFT_217739 [Tulasnella calospora MUT 4182]
MFKPRDQPGWHKASEWLLATTIAVHGFGNDYYSAYNKVSERDIEQVFRKYGPILHAQIWKSQRGGAWAFVTFKSMDDRDAAIQDLNGQTVDMWSRDTDRRILWQTPLKVSAPRFHAVRFYYNQFAAIKIVPAELTFNPSAEPGQGGTFQRALEGTRRLPPTGPRHGRRLMNKISVDTSFHTRHDRPSSPAPSDAGTSIQWGHERAETPEPASPAYDSEKTMFSSGENVSPGEDDGEEMEEYDYGYGDEEERPRSPSPLGHRRPASPSPTPSSQCDDHDDYSLYPQSSRCASEPSSQSRKRPRCEDNDEEDHQYDLRAEIRKLREENEQLKMELKDSRRETQEMVRKAEEDRLLYQQRLERLIDGLLASLERGDDGRPHKRTRAGLTALAFGELGGSAAIIPTSPSHLKATPRRHS